MGWSVVIDPAALAGLPPANRTELDLNSGPIQVDQKGIDWGDSQIQSYLADRRVGSVKVDFRMPNRKVSIPLFLMDDPSGTGLSEEQARAQLQQKVGLLQMTGGWLMRQRDGGSPTYADVIDATLTLPDVWGETGSVEPSVALILECSPDFYGDEIALDLATVSNGVLTGPLKQGGVAATIQGNHLGRAAIILSDTSGQNQSGLIWAFRQTYYDSSPTAALVFESENLDPVLPAAIATVAGRSGVQHPSLQTSWVPIVNTNVGGAQPFTHIGSYRIRARAYTTSSTSVWLRLVWGVGAAIGLITNDLIQLPPGSSNFYIVDLGEVRVDYPPIGTLRWEGQIQGQGQVGGENVFIDQIYLQPLDDTAGYASANPNVTALTSPAAADSFTLESSGDLAGQVASAGGSWTEPQVGSTPAYGPVSSGTLANHTGAGTQAWTTPTGSVANLSTFPANTTSQYLQTSNYGFAVPSGATITGLQLDIQRSGGGSVTDASSSRGGFAGLVLQNGGTVLSADKSVATVYPPTGTAIVSYGGSVDLWGVALTPAIVNSSTFGIFYAVNNPVGGLTVNIAASLFRITIFYTMPTSLNFQVDATNDVVTRVVADGNNHYALIGGNLTTTDVSVYVALASWTTPVGGGLIARYTNSTTYYYVYLGLSGAAPSVFIGKYNAGVLTTMATIGVGTQPIYPNLLNLRFVAGTTGAVQVYFNGVSIWTSTDPDLATGGVLQQGQVGLYQPSHFQVSQVWWDRFVAYSAAAGDAVCYAHAGASLRYDGLWRADPTSTYFGPMGNVVGDLPRIPPSGLENRPVELFLLLSQGDLQTKPDVGLGSFTVQLRYRPVYIHRA